MSDPGPKPDLYWLPVDRLDVDPAYQRTLDTKASQKLIHKIADGFRWISFQAILATPVGKGRWLIIDGQHRVAAARLRLIPHVPSVVVAEASQQEQAAAFVGANKDRVPVSAQAIYYARLAAGDPDALRVARVCKAAQVEMLRYPLAASKTPARKTTAISALLRLLKDHPEERITAAVCALSEAYPHVARRSSWPASGFCRKAVARNSCAPP